MQRAPERVRVDAEGDGALHERRQEEHKKIKAHALQQVAEFEAALAAAQREAGEEDLVMEINLLLLEMLVVPVVAEAWVELILMVVVLEVVLLDILAEQI